MSGSTTPPGRHRLILVYGAGPGMGKSTLASFIERQLRLNGTDIHCFYEHLGDAPAFAPYVEAIAADRGAEAQLLLDCCRRFIDDLPATRTHVTDSILPCVDWLAAAGCTTEEIRPFTDQLMPLLKPFKPLLIHLTGANDRTLHRAVRQRGRTWALALARERTDGTLTGLANYFAQLQEQSLEILQSWPYARLLLDMTAGDWDTYEKRILERLGLKRAQITLTQAYLQRCTGTYSRIDLDDGRKMASQLRIAVNQGWLAGDQLIPVSQRRFNITGTGDYIEFGPDKSDPYQDLALYKSATAQVPVRRYRRCPR
ncbi:MAG: hypothetical protein GKR89_22200 [Candidatus Latescibacteria bacterium]|nr:hypothetical protein [Candidatus Latescibacterota bacterium]